MLELQRAAGNRSTAWLMRRLAASVPDGVIQRCQFCNDSDCEGDPCAHGLDASMGGLFTPGLSPPVVAPYKEAKKESQKGVQEAEHMMPWAAHKKGGTGSAYAELPTYGLDFGTHRGGQSGAGGGITSTGSSKTSQGWSDLLGAKLKASENKEAYQLAATDAYNAAVMQGTLTQERLSQIFQTLNMHAERGDITEEEAGEIQNVLTDRALRDGVFD